MSERFFGRVETTIRAPSAGHLTTWAVHLDPILPLGVGETNRRAFGSIDNLSKRPATPVLAGRIIAGGAEIRVPSCPEIQPGGRETFEYEIDGPQHGTEGDGIVVEVWVASERVKEAV